MRKFNIILSQSEKGGCGKTTVLQACHAGLVSGGAKVLVVDADDGNSGYIRRSGKEGVVALPWSFGADSLEGWLASHLGDHDTLAIDCGANIIASAAPVNEFLGELVIQASEAGGSVTALAVASTNAPGTGRLARQMRDAYGDYAKVILIQNDQDGSGAFSRTLQTLSMPTASFPHIPAGIQAARMLKVAPLLDVLREPPEDHSIAMAYYSNKIASFISQPAVASLFGDEALSAMRLLGTKAPGPLARVVRRLPEASDNGLLANNKIFATRRALSIKGKDDRNDIEGIGRAALAWLDSEAIYDALTR